jgi:hypothetical protein
MSEVTMITLQYGIVNTLHAVAALLQQQAFAPSLQTAF